MQLPNCLGGRNTDEKIRQRIKTKYLAFLEQITHTDDFYGTFSREITNVTPHL